MPTTTSLEITVDIPGGGEATGQLDVDTSTNPTSGTFTPTGGTATDVTPVTWSTSPNGVVGFTFTVSGSANGDFPLKANQNQYSYRFTGSQNAQGADPGGNVNWPSSGIDADPDVTWQSGSTAEEEPFATGKGAS